MTTFLGRLRPFSRSDDGPTATEYAVLLGVIALGVLGAMSLFGEHLNNIYVTLAGTVNVF